MISIFTPSFADEADTNAQNLSVKEIVARLDPGRVAVTMLHEGVVDLRIAGRPHTQLLRWRKHGNTLLTLARLLSSLPQVYFFPREGPLDAAFLKLRRHLSLKTALVTYIVSGGLDRQYPPPRVRNICHANLLIANNTYLAQLLNERFGIGAEVIYDGIDRRYFFASEEQRDGRASLTILYAGSMRPYKRVPLVVLQAARWLDVRFRIAGAGEDEQVCRKLAVELKARNVEFLGHISPKQLGDEMRRADIFFFPSNIEGHPQVLGQAAASGLPVVAMKSYQPDFVVDGTTGFLARTDEELSEKLDLLIRKPDLRCSMGRAAVAHARQFDWDHIAQRWQEIFEEAAAMRR